MRTIWNKETVCCHCYMRVLHNVPHDVPHDNFEKSRQERIVELVRMNPGITRELMAKLLEVNAKTIGRELAKMKDRVVYRGVGKPRPLGVVGLTLRCLFSFV